MFSDMYIIQADHPDHMTPSTTLTTWTTWTSWTTLATLTTRSTLTTLTTLNNLTRQTILTTLADQKAYQEDKCGIPRGKREHKLMSKLFKNNHHHFQIISLLQNFCHWKFPVSEEEAVEAKFGRRVPKKTRKSHLCKDWEILFAGAEKYFYLRCNVYGNLQMSDKWTGFANVANYFKSVEILSWPHYDGGILKKLGKGNVIRWLWNDWRHSWNSLINVKSRCQRKTWRMVCCKQAIAATCKLSRTDIGGLVTLQVHKIDTQRIFL